MIRFAKPVADLLGVPIAKPNFSASAGWLSLGMEIVEDNLQI